MSQSSLEFQNALTEPNQPGDFLEPGNAQPEEGVRGGSRPSAEAFGGLDGSSFWNRFAAFYDLATASGDEGLEEAIDYVASFIGPYDVVLDAACGTGAFACGVAPHAGFVAACDYADKMVEQTKRKARRMGLDNLACGLGNLCALDFADDSFDAAIAGNVLHLLVEPRQAVSELSRVTKPDGFIIIPNYLNAEEENRRFLRLIEAFGFRTVNEWDEESFLSFLGSCGLELIDHRSFQAKQPLCVAVCRTV